MLKFTMTNFAFVPLDQTAYTVLLQAYPHNVVKTNPEIPLANEHLLRFDDASFIKLNAAQALIVQRFVESGFTVLYSNSDMCWKSNILSHLEGGLENEENDGMVFMENM